MWLIYLMPNSWFRAEPGPRLFSLLKVTSIFSLFCCLLSPSLDLVSMELQKWWQKFYRQPALP